MKKLFLIAILSVGIISGVVLSPEIWAMIEPHITITMDPGQTTKPFQILDNLGDEVFSVDVDGTIFPIPASDPIDFGTEIVILDKSANDGDSQLLSTGSFIPFGYAFALPTSANLWKITAVEFKTGDVVRGDYCVGAVVTGGGFPNEDSALELPMVDQGLYTVTNVAFAKFQDFHFPVLTNTSYKVPVESLLLEGGQIVMALASNCGSGVSQFSGTNSATESFSEFSNSGLFGGNDASIGKGGFGNAENVGFDYYMKVYAKPIA